MALALYRRYFKILGAPLRAPDSCGRPRIVRVSQLKKLFYYKNP